jgi:endonuclease YncB( thermonuclease family)
MAAWVWPKSKITRVVDGDTLDAIVIRDLGFGGSASFPVRLRLNGINAAKLGSTRGNAARDRVVALLGDGLVDITTVKPYKYGGPADANGEWMAQVVLADGTDLSKKLLGENLVAAWDGDGARPDDE